MAPTTFIVPQSGVNNYTVCSGTLYDSGGPFGNYSDGSNGYTVLNPSNPGSLMQIGGTFSGQNCCDFLQIFNGWVLVVSEWDLFTKTATLLRILFIIATS
jgi:hypothetical protein